MYLGVILHALFGALLAAFFWLFALSSWLSGKKPTGFWDGARGFWTLFAVGVVTGVASYVYREKQILSAPYDDEASGYLFWKRVPVIVLAVIAAYFIWTFVCGK